MKSWKLRLLMAFTMVAVVLAISIPAMAEDIEVACEAEDDSATRSSPWTLRIRMLTLSLKKRLSRSL